MRFRLSLTPIDDSAENSLPIDYQYMQSAVIYKVLASSDEAYASWLHDNGYQLDNGKRFKLFCYSRFRLGKHRFERESHALRLIDSQAEWTISFLPERSTQEFVQGLFNGTHFTIGNSSHRVGFDVTGLEMLPPLPGIAGPNDGNNCSVAVSATKSFPITYAANSPVCVKQHIGDRIQYLSPTDAHYSDGILKGLLSRYEVLYGKPFEGDTSTFRIEILPSIILSSLVDIKGIKVRGYLYNFRLTAPPALHHIAYDGGIGEQCSQGFGFIERKGK